MSIVKTDVVIIGAGAAGLMCAMEAGRRGRSVSVIEHNDVVGKKIRISGGGRCNFTNIHCSPANYLSANPHFCKSALSRYTPADFLKLIKTHKIAYHEKKLGQMFCDGSSQQIIDMLLAECAKSRAKIFLKTQVKDVSRTDRFVIETSGPLFEASSLVIATGGLSIPPIGATDFAYRMARRFDVNVLPTRPGLVPLKWSAGDLADYQSLSGISADCLVRVGKTSFRENILFTHRGLSGPAILQISSYWKPGEAIGINFAPDVDWDEEWERARSSRMKTSGLVKRFLSERLADVWMKGIADGPVAQLSRKNLADLQKRLTSYVFYPRETEGYAKAEVTLGGVDTKELSSQTMEARNVSGLFFVGEAVDVTGHLGGYNFQWAWASGHAAGQAV